MLFKKSKRVTTLKEFSDWQEEGLGYKEISQEDSKDERIIKGIYNALKYLELELSWDILCDEPYVDILDAYDWLEKQDDERNR